ncbi:MAG: BlaI/MecI/CopY family transcriptional regulator [Bacteroidales bacterium]
MKELTKAEEQVMQHLWNLRRAFLKDIVESYPEPRPAYTTISTVIRVLVRKGFVGYKTFGKVHEYFPRVSRHSYFRGHVNAMIRNHFQGSPVQFASFFAGEGNLALGELEEIRQLIDQKIENLKGDAS